MIARLSNYLLLGFRLSTCIGRFTTRWQVANLISQSSSMLLIDWRQSRRREDGKFVLNHRTECMLSSIFSFTFQTILRNWMIKIQNVASFTFIHGWKWKALVTRVVRFKIEFRRIQFDIGGRENTLDERSNNKHFISNHDISDCTYTYRWLYGWPVYECCCADSCWIHLVCKTCAKKLPFQTICLNLLILP